MNTKISDAIKRLERACISGMDEEFRDYVQAVLNHLAADAVPVAWMTHHDEPSLHPTFSEAVAYCDDDERPIPLYTHPQPAAPNEVSGNSGELSVDVYEARGQIEFLDQQNHSLRRALSWYEEQVSLCRKVGSLGEPGRHALDRDGGERARAALAATGKQPLQVGEAQGDGLYLSDNERAVLQQIQDALPTVGLNAWSKGVEVLERLLRDSLGTRQPVAAHSIDLGPIATRKLGELAAQGYVTNGVAIFNPATGQRGLVDNLGFVGWMGAQGIDLDLMRDLIDYAESGKVAEPTMVERMRALIDQRDAAPGVGHG